MKKTAAFFIVLSLAASIAHAYAVSCGPEQSSGTSGYPSNYVSGPSCSDIPATVYAYKNCTNQFGNACTITWNENYSVHYYLDHCNFDYCICAVSGSSWVSNTNIVDSCQ